MYRLGFLNSSTIEMLKWVTICYGGLTCALQDVSSTPGLHLLDSRSIHTVLTTKNSSRQSRCFLGRKPPQLRTRNLNVQPVICVCECVPVCLIRLSSWAQQEFQCLTKLTNQLDAIVPFGTSFRVVTSWNSQHPIDYMRSFTYVAGGCYYGLFFINMLLLHLN